MPEYHEPDEESLRRDEAFGIGIGKGAKNDRAKCREYIGIRADA